MHWPGMESESESDPVYAFIRLSVGKFYSSSLGVIEVNANDWSYRNPQIMTFMTMYQEVPPEWPVVWPTVPPPLCWCMCKDTIVKATNNRNNNEDQLKFNLLIKSTSQKESPETPTIPPNIHIKFLPVPLHGEHLGNHYYHQSYE